MRCWDVGTLGSCSVCTGLESSAEKSSTGFDRVPRCCVGFVCLGRMAEKSINFGGALSEVAIGHLFLVAIGQRCQQAF